MTDLGTYKGLPIAGHALALKGAGEGLSKAMRVSPTDLEPGEEIDLLVRCKAGNVLMRVDDIDAPSSWTVEMALTAQTITIVNREFADDKINAQLEAEALLKEREKTSRGVPPLPGIGLDKGVELIFDSDGNHVLPGDIAEMRGLGKVLRSFKPAVVVFSDGERAIWPDEYVDGVPRPVIGAHSGPAGTDIVVTALLDQVTGDPVDDLESAGDDLTPEPLADSEPELPEETALREIFNDRTGEPLPAGWDDPDPATEARLAAADVDPMVADWLDDGVGAIRMKLKTNRGIQFLEQAHAAEVVGKARNAVVDAIWARLAELRAS